MAKVAERKVIRKAIADNQIEFGAIIDFREIANGNLVLIFDHAEVVMPGNWRLNRDLCVGDVVKAYWDEDHYFHLEWK